jgi:DNA-binding NarL/FixJ family response regulator
MRVLVHSHVRLFGEGVAAFVRSIDFVEAAEVESTVDSLEECVRAFDAELVLFDVTAPSTLERAQTLKQRCSTIQMVALAVPEMADAVVACAEAGFAACVPRDASSADLASVLEHARQGETKCDPRVARCLFDELASRKASLPPEGLGPLTRRELETAQLLCDGLSNKEIAKELHLSVATVKNHVHAVLRKLDVSRRSQVANRLSSQKW